jgi:hypothetical protein
MKATTVSNDLQKASLTLRVRDGSRAASPAESQARMQVNTSDTVTIERMPGEWVVVCPVNADLADIRSLDPAAIRWHSPLIHTVKTNRLRLIRSAGSPGDKF